MQLPTAKAENGSAAVTREKVIAILRVSSCQSAHEEFALRAKVNLWAGSVVPLQRLPKEAAKRGN